MDTSKKQMKIEITRVILFKKNVPITSKNTPITRLYSISRLTQNRLSSSLVQSRSFSRDSSFHCDGRMLTKRDKNILTNHKIDTPVKTNLNKGHTNGHHAKVLKMIEKVKTNILRKEKKAYEMLKKNEEILKRLQIKFSKLKKLILRK